MAPRGMSAEEKKAVVLDVFRAAEAPFAVKEIEKAAGAKKGLHPMQIKDLVVALVDDGKVGMRKPLTPPPPSSPPLVLPDVRAVLPPEKSPPPLDSATLTLPPPPRRHDR